MIVQHTLVLDSSPLISCLILLLPLPLPVFVAGFLPFASFCSSSCSNLVLYNSLEVSLDSKRRWS
jgi:hypothetical protein